jgi:hypothetical protein
LQAPNQRPRIGLDGTYGIIFATSHRVAVIRIRRLVRQCALFSVGAALACSYKVPEPPTGPHPNNDYVEVPYPPPAAAAEVVPPSPRADAVWVDGQWTWRGRYYVWQRGGWVVPPPGAYFAPWQKYYTADGTLYFADGAWRRTRDRVLIVPPPILRSAATPATQNTPEPVLNR